MRAAYSIWKRACSFLASLLLVWLLMALFLDIKPIDDSDLSFPLSKVDPSKNPYPAIRNLKWSDDERAEFIRVGKMLNGSEPIELGFLETMLSRHAAVLDQFSRYAEMEEWRKDLPYEKEADEFYLDEWVYVGSLKCVEAAALFSHGDSKGALECAVSLLDFGSRFRSARISAGYLMRVDYFPFRGRNCVVELLGRHRFDHETLAWLAARLESPNLSRNNLDTVLLATYQRYGDQLPKIAKRIRGGTGEIPAWLPMPLVFKPNRTQELAANFFRDALEADRTDPAKLYRAMRFTNPADFQTRWAHRLSGNGLGYECVLLLQRVLISFAVNREQATRANLDLLRTRVALERYLLDRGSWPDVLGELVPAYLDSLPLDPFDGQLVRYNTTRRTIYSIGSDAVDNGGIPPGNSAWPDDSGDMLIELEPKTSATWPEFPTTNPTSN